MSDELQVTSNKNKCDVPFLKKILVTCHFSLLTRLLLAFQFLMIIPLRVKGEISEWEIGKVSTFFPLVGAFQGAFLFTANLILTKIFPVELTNCLLILFLVLSNGGLHLDGLADTFDAIASSGDKNKKLSIMKDSSIGPIGVIALFFTILLKIFALNILSKSSLLTYHFSLFLMPVFSKWTMVISMFHGKPAREDGLGKIFIKNVRVSTLILSSFLLILLFLLFLHIQIIFNKESPFKPYSSLFIAISALLYLLSLQSVRFCNKTFGGLTGDTLGAINEITEVLFLLIVIAWSHLFTSQ